MRPTRDRDQTLEAFAQDMRIFLHRASYSESARTLQQLLGRVEEALSSGDFRVVQFYVERRNYDGAISRLEKIINSHPSFSRIDEVKQLCKTLSTAKQPSNSQENVKSIKVTIVVPFQLPQSPGALSEAHGLYKIA